MFYILGQNFKIFLKIFPGFLSLMFVVIFSISFPELSIVIWLFKLSIVIFVVWKWAKKIKKHSELKFFKPSFICMSVYWGIIIAMMVLRNDEIDGSVIIISSFFWIAGMVLFYKAANDSLTTIRKYKPQIKMDTGVHSPDDYCELYSRAEKLDMEISELKKEAPPAVVEAIMQREAGKLIPFFHLEMIYLVVLMLCGTPWMPVGS